MNLTDSKYSSFALVKEMLETPEIMRRFDWSQTQNIANVVKETGRLFFTGEGSSRIFPAKNLIYTAMKMGLPIAFGTDGSWQSAEYDLTNWAVFGASNSGQTKEVVSLFRALAEKGHQKRFAMTANHNTKLEEAANETIVLSCGKENAVAATKSVVEQGLVYMSVLRNIVGCQACDMDKVADAAETILNMEYCPEIISKVVESPIIYFAGRNNGAAEELRLKTNEITRKKSDYLEGTYLLHGIEEVMNPGETIVILDPFESECAKIKELLVDKIGVNVVAIADRETIFPTVVIPSAICRFAPMLQLMAGWNLLVQTGVALGIDLDKPTRARKVGNEIE
ncbi:MAG: SIS domain-containing protein [Planctomycetia bacterium]|nr:SIS domain-containing protein [Planctomycetia bacterium]